MAASVRMCNSCAEQLPDSSRRPGLRRLEAGPLPEQDAKVGARDARCLFEHGHRVVSHQSAVVVQFNKPSADFVFMDPWICSWGGDVVGVKEL